MVDELADLAGRLVDLLTRTDGLMQAPRPGAQTPPLDPCDAATLRNALAGGEAIADLAATQTALLRESVQQMSELAEAGSAADSRGLAVQLRLIEAIAPTPADPSTPAGLKTTEP